MKAITIRAPGRRDRLEMQDGAGPGQPGPGRIRVALHGSMLDFPDLGVATGRMPSADGRVPLADGAGLVEAVGAGVTEFASGDGIDGFARDNVVVPATAMTRAPKGYDRREQQDFVRALDGGGVELVIDRRFPLDRLADAFRFEMGATNFGKIGIEW